MSAKRWIVMIAGLVLAGAAVAAQLPYDEHAVAGTQIDQALNQARTDHKDVLLVFGANWCEDCRQLDKAMHGTSQPLVNGRFEVVKVDIGNFDKNLDIANRYGNPIKKGIPAVVVINDKNEVLYSTKGGELANARRMGETGIYDFLSHNLAGH